MKFTHKGYILSQTEYNYHFMLFDKDGHRLMHVPYKKSLTEEKAKELIEDYLFLDGKLDEVGDEPLKDDEE